MATTDDSWDDSPSTVIPGVILIAELCSLGEIHWDVYGCLILIATHCKANTIASPTPRNS